MTLFQPIVSDRSEADQSHHEPDADRNARTILIINPSGEAQSKLDDQLRRLGFHVAYIREDLEALDALGQVWADVETVILDWRSEEPKHRDFAEALAVRGAEIGLPVLTLAASCRVEDIQLAFEAGLSKLITAPCRLGDLKAALEALASRKRVDGVGQGVAFGDAVALMETCKFRFRTPEDVEQLVPVIARLFPKPERAAPGIFELMMNAIEHGNLEIGHDRKAEWVARGLYQSELRKRLETPPFSERWAEVAINRRPDGVMIVIMDQGCGFCWQDLIQNEKLAPETLSEPEHGLTRAKRECFDALRFNQFGNQVTAFVAKQSLAS